MNSLSKDLGKPEVEGMFEIIAIKQELKLVSKNLKKWMAPKEINIPISLKPGKAIIQSEPLGCVLIIGPWNYPFSLTIQPLVSALAAGNTAVLKPSEHAPETSALIQKMIDMYFPSEIVQVCQGDGLVASELTEEKFDHIFFTGGGEIGKKVMSAASKNLTPVTLELGGQSPAIVLPGADLDVTARRLAWGKSLNAGQTCIAPNHLFIQQNLHQNLINKLKIELTQFYGSQPLESKHIGKIINKSQFSRLINLITEARKTGKIVFGGTFDEETRKISPTLVEIETLEHPLMKEEIFGPILPIVCISNLNTALNDIRTRGKPLAIYMFGGTAEEQKALLETTSSGGVCFNDVVMQAGVPELPFGGIGSSGIGRYHGLAGFETFSHQKSILKKSFWLDLKLRYPPYKINVKMLKQLLK